MAKMHTTEGKVPGRSRRRRRRRQRSVFAVLAVLVLAACQQSEVRTRAMPRPAAIRTAILTPEGSDRYTWTRGDGIVDARAPASNDGSQLRAVFWTDDAPVVNDSQTCASWPAQSGDIAQQGAALRIRQSDSGRVRAITVTKNIAWGRTWVFNFHTFDTARPRAFLQFGGRTVTRLIKRNKLAPFPWHFCARVVGREAEFKVWTDQMTEPEWGDPGWGGKAEIPSGWDAAGTSGWFIGHLQPGEAVRFGDLRTRRLGSEAGP